jgi:hypothetical protein
MSTRKAVIVGTVWALSLVGVGLWAQVPSVEHPVAPGTAVMPYGPGGLVLSGENIGFRVTGPVRSGVVPGTWVVMINGEWVKATGTPSAIPVGR